eukprot:1188921-Prorocentrum_minimum.AAC.3
MEEGDPGRGGLQGTRPRAGQLGGPASRGLRVCPGVRPSPHTTPTSSLPPLFQYTCYYLHCSVVGAFPGWRVGPRLLACSPTSFLLLVVVGAWGWSRRGGPGLAYS